MALPPFPPEYKKVMFYWVLLPYHAWKSLKNAYILHESSLFVFTFPVSHSLLIFFSISYHISGMTAARVYRFVHNKNSYSLFFFCRATVAIFSYTRPLRPSNILRYLMRRKSVVQPSLIVSANLWLYLLTI